MYYVLSRASSDLFVKFIKTSVMNEIFPTHVVYWQMVQFKKVCQTKPLQK